MHILQIAPRYAPAWAFGGGVRMAYELARRWKDNGHEVTVLTSDQLDGKSRSNVGVEYFDGLQVIRFPNRMPRLASKVPAIFFRPRGMAQAIRDWSDKADVVHVSESRGVHNRWVYRNASIQGRPVVWSPYGGLADGEGIRRVYRWSHDRLYSTGRVVRGTTALIAQTLHEEQILLEFGARPSQIHQIPLAVNLSDVSRLPERGAFRRRMGVSDTQTLVMFVGRLHHTKGLQVLIPAFASLCKFISSVVLMIVGWDQGFEASARKLVCELRLEKKVIFAGGIYQDERFQAYADADVFALTPGVFEETSLAALEACACATACVITHQCEIPGLDNAGAGITVPYKVEAVAEALRRVIEHRRYLGMGTKARELTQQSFSVERVAAAHEDLFRELKERSTSDNKILP